MQNFYVAGALKTLTVLTQELLQKHHYTEREAPCSTARDAVIECYEANPGDTLKCAALVSAYSECAGQAYADYVEQVNAARRA